MIRDINGHISGRIVHIIWVIKLALEHGKHNTNSSYPGITVSLRISVCRCETKPFESLASLLATVDL